MATHPTRPAFPAGAPLDLETMGEVIELVLWAGQLMMQNGAESRRVEQTIQHLGAALGCTGMDILVSPNAIAITTSSGEQYRTKIRRLAHIGIDLTIVSAINRLSRRAEAGELERSTVRSELARISSMPPHYNRWLVVVMAGMACAAFSRLFGGDWAAFGVTWLAASAAMFVRQELTRRYFNPLLVTTATAFTAGLLASSASLLDLSPQPQVALAASVLLLVPGGPLINAMADLIEGHMVTGIVRGVTGALVSLAIALGLLLAMSLAGIPGL
jgi:uncharacterized membrane protein YjjP (DUF1212 family)